MVINQGLFEVVEGQLLGNDVMLSVILSVVVWLYLSLQLKSMFIATNCLLQIGTSIPISLVIYKQVLGIEYFCPLHICVVIIIVGIGVDDVFMFND